MRSKFRPVGLIIASADSRYQNLIRADFPDVQWQSPETADQGADFVMMVIEADRGISTDEVSRFHALREAQIPALVLITSLLTEGESDRWDFDDLTMLANRTLEEVVTPYLVLHDESGQPSGLYELETNTIIDYSVTPAERRPADDELKALTADFRSEFIEADFEIQDFTSGLRVVALPYVPERGVGIAETARLITTLESIQP